MSRFGSFRGSQVACFVAAVSVLLGLTCCSRGDKDALAHPLVVSWKDYFFERGALVQDDGTEGFRCTPVALPSAAPTAEGGKAEEGSRKGQHEPAEAGEGRFVPEESVGGMVSSEPGGACLVIDTGYLKERGRAVRGEPDSYVSLFFPQERSLCRFMTIGTAGCVHGGAWMSPRVFVVFGLAEGSGFVLKADLDTRIVRKYRISGTYRKPDADEQEYFTRLWVDPGLRG